MTAYNFDDLPDDEEEAFLFLQKQFKDALTARLRDMPEDGYSRDAYLDYMAHVIGAARELNVEEVKDWTIPLNDSNIYPEYSAFELAVTQVIVQAQIRSNRKSRRFSVALSRSDRDKISHHVVQLRNIIVGSSLSIEKREAILDRLNELQKEIDRDRSRMDRFADFMSRLAAVSKDFAQEGAEPWWKWAEAILEILGKAKNKEDDQLKLPAPKERKRIEGPKTPSENKELDDDIPF
jgi:hypothetical protein